MPDGVRKERTMRIKMLDSESTYVEGKAGHYRAHQEYDLPDEVARAWIEKRIAEPVAATKKPTKQEVKGD